MMTWFKKFFDTPRATRRYYVGDIAPQCLVDDLAAGKNVGAMFSIEPVTNKILTIFIP